MASRSLTALAICALVCLNQVSGVQERHFARSSNRGRTATRIRLDQATLQPNVAPVNQALSAESPVSMTNTLATLDSFLNAIDSNSDSPQPPTLAVGSSSVSADVSSLPDLHSGNGQEQPNSQFEDFRFEQGVKNMTESGVDGQQASSTSPSSEPLSFSSSSLPRFKDADCNGCTQHILSDENPIVQSLMKEIDVDASDINDNAAAVINRLQAMENRSKKTIVFHSLKASAVQSAEESRRTLLSLRAKQEASHRHVLNQLRKERQRVETKMMQDISSFQQQIEQIELHAEEQVQQLQAERESALTRIEDAVADIRAKAAERKQQVLDAKQRVSDKLRSELAELKMTLDRETARIDADGNNDMKFALSPEAKDQVSQIIFVKKSNLQADFDAQKRQIESIAHSDIESLNRESLNIEMSVQSQVADLLSHKDLMVKDFEKRVLKVEDKAREAKLEWEHKIQLAHENEEEELEDIADQEEEAEEEAKKQLADFESVFAKIKEREQKLILNAEELTQIRNPGAPINATASNPTDDLAGASELSIDQMADQLLGEVQNEVDDAQQALAAKEKARQRETLPLPPTLLDPECMPIPVCPDPCPEPCVCQSLPNPNPKCQTGKPAIDRPIFANLDLPGAAPSPFEKPPVLVVPVGDALEVLRAKPTPQPTDFPLPDGAIVYDLRTPPPTAKPEPADTTAFAAPTFQPTEVPELATNSNPNHLPSLSEVLKELESGKKF